MKTILVDCINCFVNKGTGVFQEMYELLEFYENPKVVLTGANDEEMEKFGLHTLPYPLFSMKHDPEKTNPDYYSALLEYYGLHPEEVVYFEHSPEAVKSAASVGIASYHYDHMKKDLEGLKDFLDANLSAGY